MPRKKEVIEAPAPPSEPPPPDPRHFTALSESVLTAVKLLETSEVLMLNRTLEQLYLFISASSPSSSSPSNARRLPEEIRSNKLILIRNGVLMKLATLITLAVETATTTTDNNNNAWAIMRRKSLVLFCSLLNANIADTESTSSDSLQQQLNLKHYGIDEKLFLEKLVSIILSRNDDEPPLQNEVESENISQNNNIAVSEEQIIQQFALMLLAKLTEDEQNALTATRNECSVLLDKMLSLLNTTTPTDFNLQFNALRVIKNVLKYRNRDIFMQKINVAISSRLIPTVLNYCITNALPCNYPHLQRVAIAIIVDFIAIHILITLHYQQAIIQALLASQACAALIRILSSPMQYAVDVHPLTMQALYALMTFRRQNNNNNNTGSDLLLPFANQMVMESLCKQFIQGLVEHGSSQQHQPDVHEFCCKCIAFLSQTATTGSTRMVFLRELHEQDVESDLALELNSPSYDVQRAALDAMYAMCQYRTCRVRFGQIENGVDGVERLMQLSNKEHVREMAFLVMSTLVTVDNNATKAMRLGVGRLVVETLKREMRRDLIVQKQQYALFIRQQRRRSTKTPQAAMPAVATTEKPGDNNFVTTNTEDVGDEDISNLKMSTIRPAEDLRVQTHHFARGMIKFSNPQTQKFVANCLACLNALGKTSRMVSLVNRTEAIRLLPYLFRNPALNVDILQRALAAAGIYCSQSSTIKAQFFDDRGASTIVGLIASNTTPDVIRQDACNVVCELTSDMNTSTIFFGASILPALVALEATSALKNVNDLSQKVLKCLTQHHIPAKWAFFGVLHAQDRIHAGFYDIGKLELDSKFISFKSVSEQPLTSTLTAVYVNPSTNHQFGASGREAVGWHADNWLRVASQQQHQTTSEQRQTENITTTTITPAPHSAAAADGSHYHSVRELMEEDEDLANMMEDVMIIANNIDDSIENKLRSISNITAANMGGPVSPNDSNSWSNALYLAELKKCCTHNNCIPLGKIKRGHYLHRALLFKFLVDVSFGEEKDESCTVECEVHRGSAGRCWALVRIVSNETVESEGWRVVDLMHNIGELYDESSWQARQYCCPERHASLAFRSMRQLLLPKNSANNNNEGDLIGKNTTLHQKQRRPRRCRRKVLQQQNQRFVGSHAAQMLKNVGNSKANVASALKFFVKLGKLQTQ